MERPKRIISKPTRYVTTSSSDEAPRRQKAPPTNAVGGEIQEDIDDMREILDENPNNFNNNIIPRTEHASSHIHTHNTNTSINQFNNISNNINPPPAIIPLYSAQSSTTNMQSPHVPSAALAYAPTHSASNYTLRAENESTNTSAFTELQNILRRNSEILYPSQELALLHPGPSQPRLFQPGRCQPEPSQPGPSQPGLSQPGPSQPEPYQHGPSQPKPSQHGPSQPEILSLDQQTNTKRIHERIDRVEAQLKNINTHLESILRCVLDRQSVPRKPAVLPISSCMEMDAFEAIDNNIYFDVVAYFRNIGGFNLKEAVNLCLKEAIKDSITPLFTWWGRERSQRPLYNSRLIMAIYEAVSNNQHFQKPTRCDFQAHMREALRTAKERQRHRLRGLRSQIANSRIRQQEFWSDERPEETEQTDE